jgi:hypothetical protein
MNESDDDEPSFRIRLIKGKSDEGNYEYWEQYNPLKKSWYRLCDECIRKVCKASDSLCILHYNKENKPKTNTRLKSRNMKKKIKRLDTKVKKKNELPLEPIIDTKV